MSDNKTVYISSIKDISSKQAELCVDDVVFRLYKTEVRKFKLKAEEFISPDLYEEILDIVTKRAIKYCVHLLKVRDYTEFTLRRKLYLKKYPAACCDEAISLMVDRGYVDDKRYVQNYCMMNKDRFGAYRIKQELYKQGICVEVINDVLDEEMQEVDVKEVIQRYADQKGITPDCDDLKKKSAFCKFLVRKGISYSDASDYFGGYLQ